MVHYHKLMLVFGFIIEYVAEAASSVRKHLNSEKAGTNDDVGFSNIEQASLVRKQMRADSYMNVPDAQAESPMRKQKISGKIGAIGDVDLAEVGGTSFARKQMRASVGTEVSRDSVNSMTNPVSSIADLQTFSGKVAADGHIEMTHLLDSMPTATSSIVREAKKRERKGVNPNGVIKTVANAEDLTKPPDDTKIVESTVAPASKDAELAALTGNNAEKMIALATKDAEIEAITAGALEDVDGNNDDFTNGSESEDVVSDLGGGINSTLLETTLEAKGRRRRTRRRRRAPPRRRGCVDYGGGDYGGVLCLGA